MLNNEDRNNLVFATYEMRKDILTMCRNCGKQNGHLGGAMSAVEIMAVLYFRRMNISDAAKGKIDWNKRDRFIMSKGHGAMAMYAGLHQIGVLSDQDISKAIRGKDSVIFRHPKQDFSRAIECSVGSLGQGIGYAVGLADGLRTEDSMEKVYVMVGDGECNEGSVWESAAYASHRKLDNLTVIVDQNGLQLDGSTSNVLNMSSLAEKWKAFGFSVVEVDGHDVDQIAEAFETNHEGKPLAIVAHTVKGKDISFAENKTEWHDNYLSEKLYQVAMDDLQKEYEKRLPDFLERMKQENASSYGSIRNLKAENKEMSAMKNWIEYTQENIKKWHELGYKNIVGEVASLLTAVDKDFMLVYSDCKNRIGLEKSGGGVFPLLINVR